ncbi:MAG: phenylalanine--tRNA ligase subunit alpha, partial [Planctomycetes bacterium]|nr:phenylalanine--tRNA ligase subunit alpha [Planctomycetota bacterium]
LYVVGSRPSDAVRLQQAVLEEVAQHPGASLSSLPGDAERETARQMSRGRFALLTIETKESRRWRVTTAGVPLREDAHRTGGTEEIGELTPESLRDGSWKTAKPRAYNLSLQPPRIVAGRRHPYRSFLDGVRAKLVSLGFEEMHGPLVESEFWNMDALYMPQTHPARAIHDVYRVETRSHAGDLPAPLLGRVAAAHERGEGCGSRGWGYAFDRDATARLVLRSQGTALSSRWMAMHAKSPGKYFAIARCFRPDVVDATHASDFYQVEGIVIGTEIHYGHLRGLLEMFGRELAQAEACEVRPGYFPFTEPSVEAFIRHPRIGWMEMGGAGLFRPEVTTPPGVKGQVIAWGLGLDRMAMVALGVDDIRDLFATRLDTLRKMRSAPLV